MGAFPTERFSIRFRRFQKMLEIFFCRELFLIFFSYRPPAPLTGAAPLDPACFWIEDPSWNRLASTAYPPSKRADHKIFLPYVSEDIKTKKKLQRKFFFFQNIGKIFKKFFSRNVFFSIFFFRQN